MVMPRIPFVANDNVWCCAQVGKHLLEAFWDSDEVVGDDNLRPQAHLSADVKLFLGASWDATRSEMLRRDLRAWFVAREVGAALGGVPWGHPSLALGYAPVAAIDRGCPALAGLSDAGVVDKLGRFPRIAGLEPTDG